jgi:hypothetical protein
MSACTCRHFGDRESLAWKIGSAKLVPRLDLTFVIEYAPR